MQNLRRGPSSRGRLPVFEPVGVVHVRAYGWYVAALIRCVVLLVTAVRFT